jgi:Tol biopolymer transport system component
MPHALLRLMSLLTAAGIVAIAGAVMIGTGGSRHVLSFASNHIIGRTHLYMLDVPRGLMLRLGNLTTNGGLHWSPDGRWLAFEDVVEGAYYRINPLTHEIAPLTPPDGFSYGLAWLPDSQSVVYVSNRQRAGTSGLYRDRLDGSDSVRLLPESLFPGVMLLPADSKRLLYTASDDNALGRLIYSLEPDGSSRLVADTGRYVDDMALSPDGWQLAYTHAQPDGYYEIGLVDLACLSKDAPCSTTARFLTQNSVRDQGPVWSPDGTRIAYRQLAGGQMSIMLMTLATGETRPLTSPASSYASVGWSPDGQWLSFSSNRGGVPAIYGLDLACLDQIEGCLDSARLLQVNSFISASPVWQPGG